MLLDMELNFWFMVSSTALISTNFTLNAMSITTRMTVIVPSPRIPVRKIWVTRLGDSQIQVAAYLHATPEVRDHLADLSMLFFC